MKQDHLTFSWLLLMVPQGWGVHSKAALPFLYGTSTPAYPRQFENFYWLSKEIPTVDEITTQSVGKTWGLLKETSENSMKVAARRLNMCFLREEPEDIAIDATIGLEALLSDDEKQEMTHKLALRVAALSRDFNDFGKSAYQALQEIKGIYHYRSAVVHGSSAAHKKREISISATERVGAADLAVDYLRKVLKVLVADATLRKPQYIDRELLLQNARLR